MTAPSPATGVSSASTAVSRSRGSEAAAVPTTMPGLYRWERKIRQGAFAAILGQAMDSFIALAHCHGHSAVRVINQEVTHACGGARDRASCVVRAAGGYGSSSVTSGVSGETGGMCMRVCLYKVLYSAVIIVCMPRLEKRKKGCTCRAATKNYSVFCIFFLRQSAGRERASLGRDQQWPPYHVMEGPTATFFKGSLLRELDRPV